MGKPKASGQPDLRYLWDQEKVIKEMRGMRDKNLPLYDSYVMKNHRTLFSSAQRQFGPWSSALRAAGITQAPRKAYRSRRLTILRTLRDALEKGLKKGSSANAKVEAGYYFGSLRNAQRALKNDHKLRRGWSKEKIITVLSRMHRSKDRPAVLRERTT